MRILLLSAYDAVSHQRWRNVLVEHFDQYEWTVLSLPARYFNWRVRGNSLSWAMTEKESLEQKYDLILATSMVDLSALRGMVPSLGSIPTIVYFHENQFEYPSSEKQHHSVEPQILSFYSALCANQLVFNSNFNRDTFFSGLAKLLKKLPDHVPPNIVDGLQLKSQVLAVPLAEQCFIGNLASASGPFTLVWNHRWEYDKGPEALKACLECLPPTLNLRCHIIGQQFRQTPTVFEEIRDLLKARNWLGEWGYVESFQQYQRLLASSHLVLSTALHDFQGLSVLEGVAAGCVPVVPDRLAYREFFPENYRYHSTSAHEHEARAAAENIIHLYDVFSSGQTLPVPNIQSLSMSQSAKAYAALFNEIASLFSI